MASRKRKNDSPIGIGMTAKQMKRKKPINTDFLVDIDPLTDNQRRLFESYDEDSNPYHWNGPCSQVWVGALGTI